MIATTSKLIDISNERAVKIASKLIKAQQNKFPISIQAAIEDKCFNNCVMCDHPQKPQFRVDPDEWCNFLEIAAQKGLESVCYSGGDPFAYKGINQVMKKHIELGIKFGMLTSGYVPKSIDINLLKHADWVRISLDTVDPELYSVIRGLISIDKVFKSIDMLLENGIEVGLSPTVHNDNCDHISDVIEYAISKGIYVDLKTAYPGTYPIDKINWEVFYKYNDKLKLRIYTGTYHHFNKCSAVILQLFIDSKGDIYPCCTIGGDVTLNSFSDPIGNIKNDWVDNQNAIERFSKLNNSQRPSACSMCQGRFTEINNIAEMITTDKVFF